MAKKMKKSTKLNSTSIIIGAIGILVILFVILFIKTEWSKRIEMENVKGDSTTATSDNVRKPPIEKTAKAGEACGKSINRGCQKELICAPLMPPYKILKTTPTNSELAEESESVLPSERPCIGKPESEIKDRCIPFLPYYGACVKKGVWPPPFPKITPSTTPNVKSCYPPPPQCVDNNNCPATQPLPKGAIYCTPTPTPSATISCGWCGSDCVNKENLIYTEVKPCPAVNPPEGYKCVNVNNVCTRIGSADNVVKQPGKPLPDWWPF